MKPVISYLGTHCQKCIKCVKSCPVDAISIVNEQVIIDENKCINCNICKKVCPVSAISGEVGKLHVIDQNKCIKCRSCMQKCPFKAIGTKQTADIKVENFQC